jgi:NAD(P)-dependent dehydrogenase (short-subunit alcohol dehydrogenase family)
MTDLQQYSSLFDLEGKRIIVIGAGSGIGEAGALALAGHGADVLCADVSEDAAARVAAAIVEGGGAATPAFVDIGDSGSINALFESFGHLDVLITTPAINVRKRLLEVTEEEVHRVLSLNLVGAFNAMTAAGRRMAESGGGSIVAISSIRSQVVEPGQGVYAATKAGVLQMVRTLAAELGPQGVRVNALAPGVVETPLTDQIKNQPDWYEAYAAKGALGRWAQPIEMAGPIVFLASEASSFVTASLLVADGGWLAVDGRFTPPL